ncbi:MAG: hypothetical protein CMO20_00765 [Thermoplasmata archaeon]|nr:hypothetical protein [Thermoplasmata archaeon]|tara:strand:- start:2218 stop:5436 length:3219 start_codon:yes stop_codon:yes gene_type:complete
MKMFELPQGEPIEGEMDLGVDINVFSFDFGAISYYKPRSKKPVGHRLICAGDSAGWLCGSDKGKKFLAGEAARVELRRIAGSVNLRERGVVWTQSEFEQVARSLLESFVDPATLGTLLPMPRIEGHIPSKDLALLVETLSKSEVTRGVCGIEGGMLVHMEGELPVDAESFTIMIQTHLEGMEKLANGMEQERPLATSISLVDGSLLIAPAGDAAIAVWTNPEADHTALLANAAALLRTESIGQSADDVGEPLPQGIVVKDSKSGIDQLISSLKTAKEESVTGYLESLPRDGVSIAITLIEGIPVGIRTQGIESTEKAITNATSSSNRLQLVRLDRALRLILGTSTVDDWSLQNMCEAISSCRTRSEDRQSLLKGRLETLFGFELGFELMEKGRQLWKLIDDGDGKTGLPGTTRKSLMGPVVAELQVRIQSQSTEISKINAEKMKALELVENTRIQRDELKSELGALQELLEEGRDDRISLSKKLDHSAEKIRDEQKASLEQSSRADRLARRVSELENQIKNRAEELASALGEMESRQQLLDALEGLLSEEVRVKTELETAESRLSEIRRSIDDDERVQRVLHEQVGAQRERHRQSQAEVNELERQIEQRRDELTALEGDLHSSRGMVEDERIRCAEMDRKHTLLQSELRELMEERRQLMRELGDLDSRRGSSEAELRMLIEQAESLEEAHSLALADIDEANRIRARLSEEPLARALLGDEGGLAMLEPVLERMTSARSRGFSVVLLDRAVERALQVIQHTVDEVAQTPRYLLSTEVMDLLSQQAPETADTVRSLTRWSVQNRLEHKLSETVSNVVLDLENLLNEYEQSVTMLMHLREVLRQMVELGLPSEQVTPLENISHMPEALPSVSKEVRRLIQQALDDIYIESDQRTTGESVGLEQTVEVLEKLKYRLDVSGLTGELPVGDLWNFQHSGMLPFEVHQLTAIERPEINDLAIAHMNPNSPEISTSVIDDSSRIEVQPTDSSQTWEPIDAPDDKDGIDLTSRMTVGLPSVEILGTTDELSEISEIEKQLAELDSAAGVREETVNGVPPPSNPEIRSELNSLEDELSDLEL